MKYSIKIWTIADLISAYEKEKLILDPPYQRNYIWSLSDQKELIDSIKNNHPIPNFFFLKKDGSEYEIVDGQQRTRTILGYYKKLFADKQGEFYNEKKDAKFLEYNIPITIIEEINKKESIEKFYSVVNNSGVHLNRPEILTAKHFDTQLLRLVNELASSKKITELDIFTSSTLKRMNDIDFISEIIVLLKYGHTDKKLKVDQAFSEDISKIEYVQLKMDFNIIIDIILNFNKIYILKKTRYKQRNDFYTLFSFLMGTIDFEREYLNYFYRILVLISNDIKPTQENCEPFKTYALNCVTQSNSKSARDERLKFFNNLFLNTNTKSNSLQKQILTFYNLSLTDTIRIGKYLTLDFEKLVTVKSNVEFEK